MSVAAVVSVATPQAGGGTSTKTSAATPVRALLLTHHTDPDQLAIPHIVEATLARQLAAFGSEAFRRDGIEALVTSGLSEQDAAKTVDAVSIRYNVKTRDLYLSGADEQTLRTIAKDALMPRGVREGIDVFMEIEEGARQRGDSAFLEKHGFGTRTGGHASLWRIVGMVNAPASPALILQPQPLASP